MNGVPERRQRDDQGPPTMLMRSYQDMGHENRAFMRRIGLALITFTVGLPMIGQIVLLALGRQGITGFYWVFSGVGFAVGLCFVWPQLGIYAAEAIPSGIAEILPSRLFSRVPERRGPRSTDNESLDEYGEVDER